MKLGDPLNNGQTQTNVRLVCFGLGAKEILKHLLLQLMWNANAFVIDTKRFPK
jgi:hypothetical protein